jgi:tRNA(fMet)-specific endonuclease VapC
MIYLLDTDVFTLAHLARHGLRERIGAARAADDVVISLVTRIEVLRGRFESVVKAADGAGITRAQELLRSSEAYLAEFRVLPFNTAALAEFDRFRDDKKARKVGRNDLLIACIALAHGATLVTRNTKDYANVPGLKLENWAD